MNKIHAVLFALMMLTVSLAGCFGNDDPVEDETPVETLDDWQVHFASSAADLPTCDSATDGRLYYVDADSEFQVCTSSGWDVIDVSGPAGQDGADGTSGTNGVDGADGSDGIDGTDGANGVSTLIRILSSTTCTTGGNSFEIGADNNGDGVLDITEVIVTVDICNGVAGPAGQDGVDGNDGADGASGIDGTNGTDGQDGTDGADGTNGSASPNTMLTSISSPAASLGCNAGGRVMMQGLDNGDGGGTAQNGVLESGEVDYTTTYCSKYVIWQVADIRSGTGSSYPGQYMEILVGDTLYFDANDGSRGLELWAMDIEHSITYN